MPHRWAESCRQMIFIMKNKLKKIILAAGSIVFWILLWNIGATVANKNLILKIPLPWQTVQVFFENCTKADFWQAVATSLLHIIAGFTAAVLMGLICGVLSGSFAVFKTLTSPIMLLIRSVPVAAFIVLAWLWIPTSVLPPFISFLMVFPVIWSYVETALLSVDKRLIEMARVYGLTGKGIIKNIKIPTVLPSLRAACITGLGFAWKSGVAAEVICNPTGSIGAILSGAKSNIEYEQVFAITLTIVLLSLLLENIIKLIWREHKYD